MTFAAKLRELVEKATPGELRLVKADSFCASALVYYDEDDPETREEASFTRDEDAELYVLLVNRAPEILALIEAARGVRNEIRWDDQGRAATLPPAPHLVDALAIALNALDAEGK